MSRKSSSMLLKINTSDASSVGTRPYSCEYTSPGDPKAIKSVRVMYEVPQSWARVTINIPVMYEVLEIPQMPRSVGLEAVDH
jgi:hypothetical protein